MKNVLIIGAIALLVLAGIYWFTQGDEVLNDAETAEELENANEELGNDGGANGAGGRTDQASNNVVLTENSTGNFATIATATFLQPGYVAIYKVNSQGDTTSLGNTALLEMGTHTNVRVQLDTIVAEGETIVAVMHEDDGDGEFEFPESDFYLGNSTSAIVSDVDVVDVAFAEEAAELQAQVETTLEASGSSDVEVQ